MDMVDYFNLALEQMYVKTAFLNADMYEDVYITQPVVFEEHGRYFSDPGLSHWKVAKKVMCYLQGTKNHMLSYQQADTLYIVGFSDVDNVGCIDDKKSTSGYIFMMVGGVILWKSVKKTLTTSSIMEVEYMACYEATCQAIWL
ncbi:hypothetical protein CsatB_008815 [Cannabis sativa]